jgi:hypothetical protein
MANGAEHSGNSQTSASSALADVIVARLTAIELAQNAMNGALGLMLDTLQAQMNLLRRLHEFAKDEPVDSPVTKVLRELVDAIMGLDASVGGVEKKFERLTNIIADAYGEDGVEKSSPVANGGT